MSTQKKKPTSRTAKASPARAATSRKTVAAKPSSKTAGGKTAAARPAPASKAVTSKAGARKTVGNKSPASKTAAKKAVAKKAVAKKAVAKKAVTKKAVAKKAVTKKAVAKKTASARPAAASRAATAKAPLRKLAASRPTRKPKVARELPLEIDAAGLPPLGMSPQAFLRDYWHKRPLLIRNAFPGYQTPLMPEDLAGLACEEGALARIIQHDRSSDRWDVRTGPFQEEDFPGMPDHDWTLLVQDVDKWDPDVAQVLDQFRFLPRWRIDDVMISFAATGGSVGAHVDHYDVFLLQGHGHRRWQIDASAALGKGTPDLTFREDTAIKLLSQFNPTHDWVLGPGDMLYLPPLVPHHGVAEDPCLTFSIGMRAPAASELMADWLDEVLVEADEAIRYHDEDLAPAADPNEIDVRAMNRVVEALNAIRMNDPDRLGDWFGRFITTYRAAGDIIPNGEPCPRTELEWHLSQGAVLGRHPWSRMAWRRHHGDRLASLFFSGRSLDLPVAEARILADHPMLDGTLWSSLGQAGRDAVYALYEAGHYGLHAEGEDGEEVEEGAEEPQAQDLAPADEPDTQDQDLGADEDLAAAEGEDAPELEIEVYTQDTGSEALQAPAIDSAADPEAGDATPA